MQALFVERQDKGRDGGGREAGIRAVAGVVTIELATPAPRPDHWPWVSRLRRVYPLPGPACSADRVPPCQ